jgi:hypothetical protein
MEWNDQLMDDALRESALSLEKSYPADCSSMPELWMAIDAKRKQRRKTRFRKRLAVAATVLLISTAASIWYVSENARHTPPVVQQKHQPAKLSGPEIGTLEYINNLCKGNQIVCSSPDFKELQTELNASLAELTSINQQIKLFGNDELLLQAKTRIENHQARVIKAMVQML